LAPVTRIVLPERSVIISGRQVDLPMREPFPVVAMQMIVHRAGDYHPFLLGQSCDGMQRRQSHRPT
jgi:hypothetical protein